MRKFPFSMTLDCEQAKRLRSLRLSYRSKLQEVFRDSPAPRMEDMCSEYDAVLLHQGSRLARALTHKLFGFSGNWMGKAFHPIDEHRGVGYNTFGEAGQRVRKLPMDTCIAPSTLESGDSMFIRYDGNHLGPIRWLVGELRQVSPNVILGMGLFGPLFGKGDRIRRKIPFVMVGPTADYQIAVPDRSGTTGQERRSTVRGLSL